MSAPDRCPKCRRRMPLLADLDRMRAEAAKRLDRDSQNIAPRAAADEAPAPGASPGRAP